MQCIQPMTAELWTAVAAVSTVLAFLAASYGGTSPLPTVRSTLRNPRSFGGIAAAAEHLKVREFQCEMRKLASRPDMVHR
jgi:hypothetical protein